MDTKLKESGFWAWALFICVIKEFIYHIWDSWHCRNRNGLWGAFRTFFNKKTNFWHNLHKKFSNFL